LYLHRSRRFASDPGPRAPQGGPWGPLLGCPGSRSLGVPLGGGPWGPPGLGPKERIELKNPRALKLKPKFREQFQYSGTIWHVIEPKYTIIPCLVMLYHQSFDFGKYFPQGIGLERLYGNRLFLKKSRCFEVPISENVYKPD